MHYKTIKLNIKIPLNIHNCHFCGAQFYIATLRASPIFFGIFLTFAPMQFPFIPYMAWRYIRQYSDKTLLIEKNL